MNRFMEEALVDKLAEPADIEDLKAIRREPTRPLDDLLQELRFDDDIQD